MIKIESKECMLEELKELELSQYAGVLSIFAGGVYWEKPTAFLSACNGGNPREHGWERLLELRAYNESSELHAQRDSIARDAPFACRTVADDELLEDEYLDEIQHLDIDENRSKGEMLFATGGGRLTLPDPAARQVKIRNYVAYDEEGMAQIVDFRIVALIGGQNNA